MSVAGQVLLCFIGASIGALCVAAGHHVWDGLRGKLTEATTRVDGLEMRLRMREKEVADLRGEVREMKGAVAGLQADARKRARRSP